jgi:hypothetical protein
MATKHTSGLNNAERRHVLGITRLLVSGGTLAAVVFILCWLGTFIPLSSPTHAYIGLFTTADGNSLEALAEGTIWSLLFGALSGALFALIYNATAFIDRPQGANG